MVIVKDRFLCYRELGDLFVMELERLGYRDASGYHNMRRFLFDNRLLRSNHSSRGLSYYDRGCYYVPIRYDDIYLGDCFRLSVSFKFRDYDWSYLFIEYLLKRSLSKLLIFD